jgi:hypothetical protein
MGLFQNLCLLLITLPSIFSQTFQSVDVIPAPLIEWDQQPFTFYSGQTINVTWTSQGFASTDLARITYLGTGGTRTLTSGSGSSIATGFFATRLSDSSNGIALNVAVTVALSSNTALNRNSNQLISVLQSKLINIVPLDGNLTLGSGQNTVCDNRNLTVSWRGLGEAQFGVASVQLRRQSGFGGTQTLASVSNVPITGNNSITLFCQRTSTPSSTNPYAFEISVQEPGGSAYTGTSASFTVATAPTPSNTPSQTPTSSKTSTPTPSTTPSPSPTISETPTPTPSQTPTQSPTPSTTETARPSIDYAAIARSAADAVDTQTPAIAGVLGGIGGILILLGGFKWYQQKVMTEKRKKKLAMTAKHVRDAHALYGITPSAGITEDPHDMMPPQPSIVMYSVQGLPPRSTDTKSLNSIKKGYAPKPTSK